MRQEIFRKDVIPRHPKRLKCLEYEYPYEILEMPIKTILCMDTDKHIIVDGHHRYFLGDSEKMTVDVFGFQPKTIIKEGLGVIDWDNVTKNA